MSAEVLNFARTTVVDGRAPPHDLDAEASVLSACMIGAGDTNAVARVRDLIRPEHFYAEAHRRTFEAVLAVAEAGGNPDVVAVADRLKVTDRLAAWAAWSTWRIFWTRRRP